MTSVLLRNLTGKVCTVSMSVSLSPYLGRITAVEEDWLELKQKDGTMHFLNIARIQEIQLMPEKVQEQWREKL